MGAVMRSMRATERRKPKKTALAKEAASLRQDQAAHLRDVAIDELHELYPTTSIDNLLTWPRKARTLARAVAGKLNRQCTEQFEHDVLHTLLNSRKRGDLKRDPV